MSNKRTEKRTKTHACDLISRQAAIARAVPLNLFGREVMMVSVSELENLPSAQPLVIHCTDCEDWLERQSILGVIISELPSAQPERKKGKWVQDGIASNVFRCSECGCDAPVEPTGGCEFKSNYCYYCGADMRGEQEWEI